MATFRSEKVFLIRFNISLSVTILGSVVLLHTPRRIRLPLAACCTHNFPFSNCRKSFHFDADFALLKSFSISELVVVDLSLRRIQVSESLAVVFSPPFRQ